MKKILFSLVLLLGISDARVPCSQDPFCRPTFEKGRFNAYGYDYVLSVPRIFVFYMMAFSGKNEWIKTKKGMPDRYNVDPSKFYFDSVNLNYRWDNLEPWDGTNGYFRTSYYYPATKIVSMDVYNRGGKSIPKMTEEEYRVALDEERKHRHKSLSYYIHQLTNDIDWNNEENSKLVERLLSIDLDVAQTPSIMIKRSTENVISSEQFKKISTYQEDSNLYHFPYTHITPYERKTNKTDYYWFIDDTDIVTDYIVCTFNIKEEAPPSCEIKTAMPEKKLLVSIRFSGWHLKEWQKIKDNSFKLLNEFITEVEEE